MSGALLLEGFNPSLKLRAPRCRSGRDLEWKAPRLTMQLRHMLNDLKPATFEGSGLKVHLVLVGSSLADSGFS